MPDQKPAQSQQTSTAQKPVSRKELILEVRDALSQASGRLAEAESIHVQLVSAAEKLLGELETVGLSREAFAAAEELRSVLAQERS